MFTLAKILCLGAIGNYFMGIIMYGQMGGSEIHQNLMGMTNSIHCGHIHPSLSMIDSCDHYGISLSPSPLGIPELTRLALCGRYIDTSFMALHIQTDVQKIHQLSIMRCNISTAWNIHDAPIIPGIGLQTEFIAFADGILHCTELDIGIGAMFIPFEYCRTGILFHYPMMINEEFMASMTQPLLTVGLGLKPIDAIALDIDIVASELSSGMKPMISWNLLPQIRTIIGFSIPHSSGSIGLSMLIDDIFVQATMFNHIQLGYSWHLSMRYCPNQL